MIDTIAAEWDKTRSVRSTRAVLAVVASLILAGVLFMVMANNVWDGLPPERRATFAAIPMERYLLPMIQLCFGVYGTLAIAAEYATGMIGTSMAATPRRGRLLAAKTAVVAAVSLLAGTAAVIAIHLSTRWVVGDRPLPNHTASFTDELPMLLASGLSVALIAVLGLGMATALRSTAVPLVVLSALLFVVPTFTQFLPEAWADEAASMMLPALPGQLASVAREGPNPVSGPFADAGVLSPLAATAVMAGYVVLAVGVASLAISRRDV
ncbi:ABC-2 family transporter [Murinocardiopsis flavida]|uniref:ABC-2 family transporter n=1 Tax=Murinocardiopsis flavida TaxID=645275 RepID=A0A2P8DH94_9ACTN|nr:ABC transporter permease [Murinocardiopsis flavida]PSK96549.1 ABC-2 family transporter [Murinocardiopsis flavida]